MRRPRHAAREAVADAPFDGPLLSCTGVDVAYDKVQILFGVDMEVEQSS